MTGVNHRGQTREDVVGYREEPAVSSIFSRRESNSSHSFPVTAEYTDSHSNQRNRRIEILCLARELLLL